MLVDARRTQSKWKNQHQCCQHMKHGVAQGACSNFLLGKTIKKETNFPIAGMNRIQRDIKVAVINRSKHWDQIRPSLFDDFTFKFPQLKFNEDGANIRLDFFFDTASTNFFEIGDNPYERPYLFIYLMDLKANGNASDDDLDQVRDWSANANMTRTTFLILVFQEDRTFFGSKDQFNPYPFVADPVDIGSVIAVPYKKKFKIPDQTIENVRKNVIDKIISDFEAYDSFAYTIATKGNTNPMRTAHLRVWHHLHVYSFGYLANAYRGFISNHREMLSKFSGTLQDLLNQDIVSDYIKEFPLYKEDTETSVLMFALHGALCVDYHKSCSSQLVVDFFKHFIGLRKLCVTDEDHHAVNVWGIKNILIIWPIGYLNTFRVLGLQVRLFCLMDEENDPRVSELFQQIWSKAPRHMKYTLQGRYVKYLKRNDLPINQKPFVSKSAWNINAQEIHIQYYNVLNNCKHLPNFKQMVEKLATAILNDRTPLLQYKNDCLMKLRDATPRTDKVHLENPFYLPVSVKSTVFSSAIPSGSSFSLFVKVKMPSWCKIIFDSASISFQRMERIRMQEAVINFPDLENPLHFGTFLAFEGVWQIVGLTLSLGSCELNWDLSQRLKNYKIIMEPHEKHHVDVEFPCLNHQPNVPLKMKLKLDYRNLATFTLKNRLFIRPKTVVIPPQNGYAIFVPVPNRFINAGIDTESYEIATPVDDLPTPDVPKPSIPEPLPGSFPPNPYSGARRVRPGVLAQQLKAQQAAHNRPPTMTDSTAESSDCGIEIQTDGSQSIFDLSEQGHRSSFLESDPNSYDQNGSEMNTKSESGEQSESGDAPEKAENEENKSSNNENNEPEGKNEEDEKKPESDQAEPDSDAIPEGDTDETVEIIDSVGKEDDEIMIANSDFDSNDITKISSQAAPSSLVNQSVLPTFETSTSGAPRAPPSPIASRFNNLNIVAPSSVNLTAMQSKRRVSMSRPRKNSNSTSVQFTIDEKGSIKFIGMVPSQGFVTIPITFIVQDENLTECRLKLKTKIDKSLERFVFEFKIFNPIVVSSRVSTSKVNQIEIKNICDTKLNLINFHKPILPHTSYFFLAKPEEKQVVLQLNEDIGVSQDFVINLEEIARRPKIELKILCDVNDLTAGWPFKIIAPIQPCKLFKLITNNDFAVSGCIETTNFNGGNICYMLIPLKSGRLCLPTFEIDNIQSETTPKYVHAKGSKVLGLGPFF